MADDYEPDDPVGDNYEDGEPEDEIEQKEFQTVLCHGDAEFISNYVKTLPTNKIKYILEELSNGLNKSYPNSLKWVKEILRIHLRYFIENPGTEEIVLLQNLKESLKRKYVPETWPKLIALRGVVNLLNRAEQSATSEESDSEE